MSRELDNTKAVVVLSGGQDSTTCLAWALKNKNFNEIHAITFNYGQVHNREIECAKKIVEITKIQHHKIVNLKPIFDQLTISALLSKDGGDVGGQSTNDSDLPASFVPFRNLIFLTSAAAYAYSNQIKNLVTGVCQTDYSGYFDCRDSFIKSLNESLNLAVGVELTIHTPLMWKTKAETVKMMSELEYFNLYKHTHTCYNGTYPACGECPACLIRLKGFKESGFTDPMSYK